MPSKHPIIVALEERVAKKTAELLGIEIDIRKLVVHQQVIQEGLDEDRKLLAEAAHKPRTKKGNEVTQ